MNQVMQARVPSRQESINMRLKQWEILKYVYCHAITKHGYVFLSNCGDCSNCN
jgi:hypothetical protein